MKHYDVRLTFHLLEEVTPDLFMKRVLEACANNGALRIGEGILLPSDPKIVLKVKCNEPIGEHYDFDLRSCTFKPKPLVMLTGKKKKRST